MLSSSYLFFFFFFNDTATTEIYTLSLHDALPILRHRGRRLADPAGGLADQAAAARSEEHTSELQSHVNLVCRLLLEKKKSLSGRWQQTPRGIGRILAPGVVDIGGPVVADRVPLATGAATQFDGPVRSFVFFFMIRRPLRSTLFPYTTLFR